MKRLMTPDILVNEIMAALGPNGELVWSTKIDAYCDEHGIKREDDDPGAPNNNIYWECNLAEGRGKKRLLKFKVRATRNALNLFALRLDQGVAPAPAGGHIGRRQAHEAGYVECVWDEDKGRWDWQNAETPEP